MSDPKVNQLSYFQVISLKLTQFYKVLSIPLQELLNTSIQTHSTCIHFTKKEESKFHFSSSPWLNSNLRYSKSKC